MGINSFPNPSPTMATFICFITIFLCDSCLGASGLESVPTGIFPGEFKTNACGPTGYRSRRSNLFHRVHRSRPNCLMATSVIANFLRLGHTSAQLRILAPYPEKYGVCIQPVSTVEPILRFEIARQPQTWRGRLHRADQRQDPGSGTKSTILVS